VTAPAAGEADNATTLAAYEARAEVYRVQTDHGPQAPDPLVERLATLAPAGVVLEIGSAYGRDADALGSLGRQVRRTDATWAFVRMQRAQGHDADVLDVLRDPLVDDDHGPYAAVLANAVFLHFSPEQLHQVLTTVRDALVPEGLLGFTVKIGDGAGWSDHKLGVPRWFQYWQPYPLRAAVEAARLEVVDVSTRPGANWDWLVVLARPRLL
jgi:hypothetical protein